jgi:hypothetical protein
MSRPTYVWGQRRTQEREEGEQSEHTDEEDDVIHIDDEDHETRAVCVDEESDPQDPEPEPEPRLEPEPLREPEPEPRLEPEPELQPEPEPEPEFRLEEPRAEPSLIGRFENFVVELRAYSDTMARLHEVNTAVTIQNLAFEQEIAALRAENRALRERNDQLTEAFERVEKERDEFRADYEIYKDAARAKFRKTS